MGRFVDLVGRGHQLFVGGRHRAGHGRIEIANGLDALHGAERSVGGNRVADLGHVNIDDVAQ